jgi:Rap1a immunity proteins
MKFVQLMLCASMTIWTASSVAQTKQSPLMEPVVSILTLNKMCQEKINTSQHAICVAYLRGLLDGMQQAKLVDTTKDTFCPPTVPDFDQLRQIIEKWVHDNPTETKVTVGFAAPMAFSLAFPCN